MSAAKPVEALYRVLRSDGNLPEETREKLKNEVFEAIKEFDSAEDNFKAAKNKIDILCTRIVEKCKDSDSPELPFDGEKVTFTKPDQSPSEKMMGELTAVDVIGYDPEVSCKPENECTKEKPDCNICPDKLSTSSKIKKLPEPSKKNNLRLLAGTGKEERPDSPKDLREYLTTQIIAMQGFTPRSKGYKQLRAELDIMEYSGLEILADELNAQKKEEAKIDSDISGRKFKSKDFRGKAVKSKLIIEYTEIFKQLPENLQSIYARNEKHLLGMEIQQIGDLVEEMKGKTLKAVE